MQRISKFSFIVLDIAVLILVLGLVYVVLYGTVSNPPATQTIPMAQSAISFTTSTIQETSESEYYTINVEYPKFNSTSANAVLEKHVTELVADFKKEYALAPNERMGSAPQSTMDYGFEIITADPDILSVRLINSIYSSGAAHPNTLTSSFNYDVANNKLINLSYLFGSSDFSKRFSMIAETTLRKNLGEDLQVEHPQITNKDPSFVIDHNSIVFTFNPYAVAAYVAGPQEVTIPIDQFKDMLTIEGKKIFKVIE